MTFLLNLTVRIGVFLLAFLCVTSFSFQADNVSAQDSPSPEVIEALMVILWGGSVDSDDDGVPDDYDAFPDDPLESEDSDRDGVGNNSDAFPNDADEFLDTDGDGIGNNADNDDDGDGVSDTEDAAPLDPTIPTTNLMVLSAGSASATWDLGIGAYDVLAPTDCRNDGGAGCPSIGWREVVDDDRGNVLEVEHSNSGDFALLYIQSNTAQDLSGYANGALEFDIKVISGDPNITVKLDCGYPCSSGDQYIGERGVDAWEAVQLPMSQFNAEGFDITAVNTGIVIWATNTTGTVFRLENVRFTGYDPDLEWG